VGELGKDLIDALAALDARRRVAVDVDGGAVAAVAAEIGHVVVVAHGKAAREQRLEARIALRAVVLALAEMNMVAAIAGAHCSLVMRVPGLDPGIDPRIHVLLAGGKTWMAGTSPAMTGRGC
jgi:microcompartment protein CcmK/EutM